MTRALRSILAVAACVSSLAVGTALGQGGSAIGDRPDCVTANAVVRSEAFGYRHIVHVANACDIAVDCRVFTDVNPEVQNIHLAPGASTDVMTFMGSPASTFVAHVDCPHQRARVPLDPGE